jgi:diguanylate cyclase (GGDEF)-like protein
MTAESISRINSNLKAFVLGAGIFVVAISCLVLSGWALDINLFKTVFPGFPSMKANTAVCFLLAGLSLLLLQRTGTDISPHSSAIRRIAPALSLTLTTVAAITLSQYLFNWNSGLDELLFRVPKSDAALPGRMSSATAFEFILIGVTLLLLSGKNRFIAAGQLLAAISMFLSLLALLAYLFGADLLRVTPFSSVAIHTAFTFFVLSAGALNLWADSGWFSVFTQDTPTAMMGRYFLTATLLVLPVVAELRIIGQKSLNLYGPYFGIAILTVSGIVILSILNWFTTRTGNAADKKISNLNRLYAVLSGINQLIVHVHSREELFHESCRIAGEVGRFPWVWIATVDSNSKQGNLVAYHGADDKLLVNLKTRLSPDTATMPEDSLVWKAVSQKSAVVLNSFEFNPELSAEDVMRNKELQALGIHSLAVLPLVVGGETMGVFTVHAGAAGIFDTLEMRLLNELAGDIAFAVNKIEQEAKLNYLTYYDAITGLPNRALFIERLQQAALQAARSGMGLAVIKFDIERFRNINSGLGQTMGDELLRQIAARMIKHAEVVGNMARINADRFSVFFSGLSTADDVARAMTRLFREIFGLPFMLQEDEFWVMAKCGIALFPHDGVDAISLFNNAESALKDAKDTGERYLFYSKNMSLQVAKNLVLENKLHQALEKNEFVLYYQPKVDAGTLQIIGVEALIRWQSPELGLVPPLDFIPLMEETGMIIEVGAWALGQANHDYQQWVKEGVAAPRIAVNISSVQLRRREFNEILATAIADNPASHGIDLEITESVIMNDVVANSEKLKIAHNAGMSIAVDDFGTGYSSLFYLAKLPVQFLKIDRSFIITMQEDENIMTLVSTIISLAHSLNLKVVAEGVESVDQLKILRDLKCDQIQGYLISKPLPWVDLLGFIRGNVEQMARQ